MNKSGYNVKIPQALGAELQLEPSTPTDVTLENDKLILTFKPAPARRGQGSLIVTSVVALFWGVLFLLLEWLRYQRHIDLSGDASLASWVIVAGLATGVALFTTYFIKQRNNPHNHFAKHVYWRNFPVIVVSVTLILALVLVGLFWMFGYVFKGASFDIYTGALLVAGAQLAIGLAMTHTAEALDVTGLANLLSVTIVGGVILAMLSNSNREWWKVNLSFLGTAEAANSWQFNVTLIFSALLMVAFIDYLFVSLAQVQPATKKIWGLRLLLTLTAIDLGLVGAVPNNAGLHDLHSQIAGFLVVLILALIVLVRWLLPGIDREFLWLSYLTAAILLGLEGAFQVLGLISLTVFEMLAFAIAFGWLLLLLNRVKDLAVKHVAATLVVQAE